MRQKFNALRQFFLHNTGLRQTVIKNTFWLFFGHASGRALRAIIIIYAARALGAEGFGTASYALSLAAVFTIVADMGFSMILTKEAAKNPHLLEQYFSTTLVLKLIFIGISCIAILIIGPVITRIPDALALLPLAILVLILDTIREFMLALAHAREKMEYEAALSIATNTATVIFSLLLLFASPTAQSLLIGYALGSGFGLVLALWAVRYYLKKLFTHFTTELVRPIMRQAFPLALSGLLSGTMLNVDTLMLGWWRTAAEVGLYSAAQKPIQIMYMFTAIIAASIFPAFSRFAEHDRAKLRATLRAIIIPTITINACVATISIIFGARIIKLLYGAAYADAIFTFQILAPTIIINTIIIIGINALFAINKQKTIALISTLAALSNAGLNAVLIPRWGIEGAALSTLVTQLLTNGYLWIKIREI